MKKRVLVSLLFPLLFTSCVEKLNGSKDVEVVKEERSNKYDIYTLEEYKELNSDKKIAHELVYTEEQFRMFEKPFSEVKGFRDDESITLSNAYVNILDILKDKVLLKRFSEENPSTIIYRDNKMMPIFFSKCGSCIGGKKYFMELENNILKIKFLSEVVYDLANPIPCELEE